MESVLKKQYAIANKIEHAYINDKKSPKERLRPTYISSRIEILEKEWSIFTNNHTDILEITGKLQQNAYFEDNLYDQTEESYLMYKSDMLDVLNKLKPSFPNCNNENESKDLKCSNVKLPKVEIPKFSGLYSEWITFRDLYNTLIHQNSSISSVEKMHYLKSQLVGEAEQLLRHVPISDANYLEAWNTLNHRYNNKRFLANSMLKRFMNHPIIINESSSAIKSLLDVSHDTLNGLKNLDIDINSWDVIIIYVVSAKLDSESRKQWETKICETESLPTWETMRLFLEARFRSLEFFNSGRSKAPNSSTGKAKVFHTVDNGSKVKACIFCKNIDHKIGNCMKFSKCDVDDRRNFVQKHGLCFNCLGYNHTALVCRIPTKCRVCNRKHHSMLHPKHSPEVMASTSSKSDLGVQVDAAVSEVKASLSEGQKTTRVSAHFTRKLIPNQVLLATALVETKARSGHILELRALLDQGSQASFITESAVQLLGLKKTNSKSIISGLGGDKSALASKGTVTVQIQSRHDPNFVVQVRAHVLRAITSLLPSNKIAYCNWPELADITLADPNFNRPNKIDILLGADVYGQVIRDGLIKGTEGLPTAQNTAFGWIISGPIHPRDDDQSNPTMCHHIVGSVQLIPNENEFLKQFWEIESVTSEKPILSQEEQRCEEFYNSTTKRDTFGRYIVRLPFRDSGVCTFEKSRDIALKRFYLLENRLQRDPELYARYSKAIQEYLDLGHMEVIPKEDPKRDKVSYLPHHPVVREDKATTKVRPVFDASVEDKNGVSLNKSLMIGPTLQQDLRHIVMRWRTHPICLSADIVKMYRQVIVADEDADFQRLLWRSDHESEIKDYRLVRVTFGTASAPYLAVKTLQQVAIDEVRGYEDVAKKVKTDFFVDDLLTGCETVEEGRNIYKKMKELLAKGGFELQKWMTNCKELAKEIMNENSVEQVTLKMDNVVKILGISWDRKTDSFHYSVKLPTQQEPITKRRVISEISRLFDPLGWIAPCVIPAKVMIQKLWLIGIDWDEELPPKLLEEWLLYRKQLAELRSFEIPRWIQTLRNDAMMELHGFCDASNVAYAAVVYLRSIGVNGSVHTNLVSAKTKVAPTMQVSIPRLELMGAVLLARLMTEIAEVLAIDKTRIHGWTDSTVVLAWLSSHPSRWTTFIGNRTSDILSRMDNTQWAHVQSAHNPADIASRGSTPSELSQNNLWLNGPSWLAQAEIEYPRPKSLSTDLEQRKIKTHLTTKVDSENAIWTKYSSLRKLVRVVAYCRRFLKIKENKEKGKRFETYLTCEEINNALNVSIKQCQKNEFGEDKKKLKSLCPVLDNNGILRVGGRLNNANLSEDEKHPIILPHKSHFTNLIVADAHMKTLHGGPLLMLNHLRKKFWIISAKNLVKAHVHKCVVCVRQAAVTKNQLMGQLPLSRVTPAKPFLHSGVDFAGPINMRMSKGRGNKSYKGYICLFVCMATKAIHLEAVSDMTTQGFIAGYKRFVSRRGHVSDIWSDNGTNFVGAHNELRALVAAENSSMAIGIRKWLSDNNVTWHFIPPNAPNFGGLWEAGVKSVKFHLKRVIGNSTLTYEEISTVLTQIEACLNSRPLSALPNNHEDPLPLTPGHFLVGEPLITVPERNYEQSNISTLKRWQLTQRMMQDFWRRWSNEYLVNCIQRRKWSNIVPEPNVGDVVIVKEDNLPPARWLLGKIVEKHPGLDNVTRVVTLKCKGTLIKRPTSKLCVLPVTE